MESLEPVLRRLPANTSPDHRLWNRLTREVHDFNYDDQEIPTSERLHARIIGKAVQESGLTGYTWTHVRPTAEGDWEDDPNQAGGWAEYPPYWPAFERSGNVNVPTD